MKDWIRCKSSESYPRLELRAEVVQEGDVKMARTFSGLRLRIQNEDSREDDPDGRSGSLLTLFFRPIELPAPFRLNANLEVVSLQAKPTDEIILEGLENLQKRFLDLVIVSGWKLVLTEAAPGKMKYALYFYSDWELDVIPAILPGYSKGEAVILGDFGEATNNSGFGIEISWPFSRTAKLKLKKPIWSGVRWKAPLDISTIGSLMEGTGPLLKKFAFGAIDLKKLAEVITVDEVPGAPVIDFLFLESGEDQNGFPQIDLVITTPDEVELASFAGFRLLLFGRAALALRMTFTDDYFSLGFVIKFGSENATTGQPETGLRLEGPIIRKITELAGSVREIASVIPGQQIRIPEIKFEYLFDFINVTEHSLGDIKIPLRPELLLPEPNSVLGFLNNLTIPSNALNAIKGFKLGGLDGGSPAVQLLIEDAKQFSEPGKIGIELKCLITFVIFSKNVEIRCVWAMAFDTQNLAFDPAAKLEIDVLSNEIEFAGLKISGLKSMNAHWGRGGIVFSASGIEASFVALSEPGDTNPGLKFVIDNLTIDSGGLDMQARLEGGSSKLSGIGDVFKGKEGGITISRSKFTGGFIRVEGPLPWFDNATGSIMLTFDENFGLANAKAEFQLGIHQKTDWWVELTLNSINIDLYFKGGKPDLILKITGKIGIKPPEGSGDSILGFLKSAELEFNDLVLTKSFDKIPPGLALTVVLTQPKQVNLLNVFSFEMRSIGFGSGFGAGEAAITVGGQIFFSSKDTKSTDPEFHKFKIGNPEAGKFLPRVSLEKLGVNFSSKPYLELTGSTEFHDTPVWKGFKGSGTLTINNSIKIAVVIEFSKVLRDTDQKELRVWMIYAEWMDINAKLLGEFYLRDVGIGFGWRKTLNVMDNPTMLLADPSKSTSTIAPHLPTSWKNDLGVGEEEARWTIVLSSWLTYEKKKRTEVSSIVGDVMIGLRSDLTVLFSMRGWLFAELDTIKKGGGGAKPSVIGILYYSPPNRHLLATYVVDPGGTPPKGVPPAIVSALIKSPFSFILETKPDLFRLELGFPRQLTFPLGAYTGRAGFLLRKTTGALIIGVSFEISIDKEIRNEINFGIGKVSLYIKIYVGVYGTILMRIGNRPALYGMVGINARITIELSLSVDFKIGFRWFSIHIKFSFSQSLDIALSAHVEFGISNAGFGMAGYASISVRIWKFSFAASCSFEINGGALREAKSLVFEGVTALGDENKELPRIPLMPEGIFPIPQLPENLERKWRTFYIQKNKGGERYVYVLLLPEKNAWFADPELLLSEEPSASQEESSEPEYETGSIPDYTFLFETTNLELSAYTGISPEQVKTETTVQLDIRVPWNEPIPQQGQPKKQKLGSLFYEPASVRREIELMDYIIEQYKPELIKDARVREQQHTSAGDVDKRPDVRSPKFPKEDSLYDWVLENGFQKDKGTELNWQQIALAHTGWLERIVSREEFNYLFDEEVRNPPEKDPAKPEKYQHWRKSVLDKVNVIKSTRAGIVSSLLAEFRKWTLEELPAKPSKEALDELLLLKHSGLAFRFKVMNIKSPYRLHTKEFKVTTSEGTQTFDDTAISNNEVTEKNSGLGFAKEEFDYSIRDILEFQDGEGIHFSWILECRDADNTIFKMDEHLASGVGTDEQLKHFQHFEYFDHYLVQRINLSKNEKSDTIFSKEIRPGFIPAFPEESEGKRKFYLVTPRFEFSDIFSSSDTSDNKTDIGDDLIYRFCAVDVFGVQSQVTELITSRKNLESPPPPEKGRIEYSVLLNRNFISETITFHLERGKEILKWPREEISFELWYAASAILPFGYYGMTDPVTGNSRKKDSGPVINPEGMTRVTALDGDVFQFESKNLDSIAYGKAYTFYVRTVSKEGNASRLIRCEVNATFKRNDNDESVVTRLSILERVPPPSNAASSWSGLDEIRHQLSAIEIPVYSGDPGTPISYNTADKPTSRELILKFLHPEWVDNSKIYVTGGYEIYTRDMDTTVTDSFDQYQKMGDIEVVSPEEYILNPHHTEESEKWITQPLGRNEVPAAKMESEQAGKTVILWGDPVPLFKTQDFGYIPDGLFIHSRLFGLLEELKNICQTKKYDLQVTGGLPSEKDFVNISFSRLLDKFSAENDPYGINLIKWMGRMVEISIRDEEGSLTPDQFNDLLLVAIESSNNKTGWLAKHNPVLEILLNSDKATAVSFYRLSLHPRIELMKGDNALNSFNTFRDAVNEVMKSMFLPGLPGLTAEKIEEYWILVSKYPKQYPLSGEKPICVMITWFKEAGSFSRPANPDGSVSLRIEYNEEYARRFAYRIKRLSRYYPLYKRFDLIRDEENQGQPLFVRFPRVKPPRPPVTRFLGNFWRGKVLCAEWILEEHEEEAMVQSNESLRNTLGYKGFAWKLLIETKEGFREGSSWNAKAWYTRSTQPDDKGISGLSEDEKNILSREASWDTASELPFNAGLEGHPFTGLLEPKGTVIRVAKPPYYYQYRLAAFSRTEDIDSIVKISDPAQAEPSVMPEIKSENCGWRFHEETVEVWWPVPSVWQSLDAIEGEMWQNEKPFAERLWDFDIYYTAFITINTCRVPLFIVKSSLFDKKDKDKSLSRAYTVRLMPDMKYVYLKNSRGEETIESSVILNPFNPVLTVSVFAKSELQKYLTEDGFEFELQYQRNYGKNRLQQVTIFKKHGI